MALQGSTIASTYLKLIRINTDTMGADATASFLQDSADTDSALSISTTRVGIGTATPANHLEVKPGAATAGIEITANGGGSSQLLFSDGSSGRGKIIFDHGASQEGLRFETAGANQLFLATSGNVGIGPVAEAIAPDRLLHIVKSSGAGVSPAWGESQVLIEENDSIMLELMTPNDKFSGIAFTDSAVSGAIVYDHGTSSGGTANSMHFRTAGNDIRMIIDGSGLVGINEAVPLTKLHIQDGAGAGTIVPETGTVLTIEGDGANGAGLSIITPAAAGKDPFICMGDPADEGQMKMYYEHDTSPERLHFEVASNDVMVLTNDSAQRRIGVGTASPVAILEIEQGASGGVDCVRIDNKDVDKNALYLQCLNTTADCLHISADAQTTTHAISITSDALTSGGCISVVSDSADDTARSLVSIVQDHANAGAVTGLYIRNDSSTRAAGMIKTLASLSVDKDHIQFSNESGTLFGVMGLCASSGDTFIGTNTDQKLILLDSSKGMVGINYGQAGATANVRCELDVLGPDGSSGWTDDLGTDTVMILDNSASIGDSCQMYIVAGANGNSHLYFGDTANRDVGSITYKHGTAGEQMVFEVNDNDYFYIDTGGNVGVGVADPGSLLHVRESDTSLAPHASAQICLESETTNYLQFLTDNDQTSGILFGDEDDVDIAKIAYNHNTEKMEFYTQGADNTTTALAMTIDTSQKVGIGTNAPATILHVGGTVGSQTSRIESTGLSDEHKVVWQAYGKSTAAGGESTRVAEVGVTFNDTEGSDQAAGYLRMDASDGADNYLYTADDDTLRWTGLPANIGSTTGTSVAAIPSDERMKNISSDPFPYGLEEVNKLSPIRYKYKTKIRKQDEEERLVEIDDDGNSVDKGRNPEFNKVIGLEDNLDAKDELGFGAQTIQSIIPECVNASNEPIDDSGEGSYSMSYHQLIPVLIKAVQELSAKVTALESNNQTGDSNNGESNESSSSGDASSESGGEDSGGAEGSSDNSSSSSDGESTSSESSSDASDESSGSSGSDSSDDSSAGSGGDDSEGSSDDSSGDGE